jgi:nicotinamidase-related amidase
MIDHQSGLFQTVTDISLHELRTNAMALAKVAALLNIPLITTSSVPEGPNGPLMPELQQVAPHAKFVPRTGEINAWHNQAFAEAVRASDRQNVIIAGVWTSVCVALPALSALSEGFKVYAVMDASGNLSSFSTQVTMTRLSNAGVEVIDTVGVCSELQRTWRREDAPEYARLYAAISPHYGAAVEQHDEVMKAVLNTRGVKT